MTAKELVAQVHLPPASHTALKLVGLLDHPTIDNDDVVQIIRHDNVLTAKLLRACNSSHYGFDEQVASVEQAVLILGHQEILRVVFAIVFKGTMSRPMPGYAAQPSDLWHHSLVTAFACEALSRDGLPFEVEPAAAFTAGLLHDIGKLAINEVMEEKSQAAIRILVREHQRSCAEAEQEVLGTDHAEVGSCLLKSWKLPPEIVEAAANHHHPVYSPQPQLSAVVHAADCLAHLLGSTFGWEAFAVRVADGVAETLALTPEKMEEFLVITYESLAQVDHIEKLK